MRIGCKKETPAYKGRGFRQVVFVTARLRLTIELDDFCPAGKHFFPAQFLELLHVFVGYLVLFEVDIAMQDVYLLARV